MVNNNVWIASIMACLFLGAGLGYALPPLSKKASVQSSHQVIILELQNQNRLLMSLIKRLRLKEKNYV